MGRLEMARARRNARRRGARTAVECGSPGRAAAAADRPEGALLGARAPARPRPALASGRRRGAPRLSRYQRDAYRAAHRDAYHRALRADLGDALRPGRVLARGALSRGDGG